MSTICLNMIVKNESEIIERCLASVLPVIDHYVVCDTGSSDDTIDRVRRFFDARGLPGEIHQIDFVDFEQTRNRALDLCRASPAEFDYLLVADADMELVVESDAFRDLAAPAYLVRQSSGISYYNTRLLRRDVSARYVGVTHEYLKVDGRTERLEGVHFIDHACGANRFEKTDRDLRLLTEGLQREPDNARYMFYLAQTYRDAGQFAEAVSWYERRIAAGGWDEEAWFARYMAALCFQALGDEAQFLRGCLEAYAQRPWRAEPLHALAKHYRMAGKQEAAMLFCEAAAVIPHPDADLLFVDDQVYRTGITEEMSICGFYSRREDRRRRGYESCMQLLTSRDADDATRWLALCNSVFYVKSAAELFPGFAAKEISVDVDAGYHPLNPSIWIHEGTPYCIVRTVNYTVDGTRYTVNDPGQVILTRNLFVRMDGEFNVIDRRAMPDRSSGVPRFDFPVDGFEDCRLFHCRGGFWCSCTVRDRNPAGRCEIAVLKVADAGLSILQVDRTMEPKRHQKNWMPLVRDDELYFIYTVDPTIVLRFDLEGGAPTVASHKVPPLALPYARGGSQAVRVNDGWLCLIHDAFNPRENQRFYWHRFVLLDDDFAVRSASEPFYFRQKGIEFCAGLAYDHRSQRFVASFGANDARVWLGFFDRDAVLDRL